MLRRSRPNFLNVLEDAQRLAFAPFIFEAAAAALRLGVLDALSGAPGMSPRELAAKTKLPLYAVEVMTDILVPAGVLRRTARADEADEADEADGTAPAAQKRLTGLTLTEVGDLLVYDEMTRANFFFTESVCYDALGRTRASLVEGRPAGLEVFNPAWKTIYPHLPELPDEARSAWFGFDHWHSDRAYESALDEITTIWGAAGPKKLADVGGNTGRFSKRFLERFPESRAVVVDLLVEVDALPSHPELADVKERLEGAAIDWLTDAEPAKLPALAGVELFWMSQFLDCFSHEEAVSILTRTRRAMAPGAKLAVLEPLVDEQRHRAAELSLAATSLYFTVIANGNSRFFNGAELRGIFREAGFTIEREVPDLGVSHTLFLLKPEE